MEFDFDLLVSSPLFRAKEIAKIINKQLGNLIEIKYSDLFKERFEGNLTNLHENEKKNNPKYKFLNESWENFISIKVSYLEPLIFFPRF